MPRGTRPGDYRIRGLDIPPERGESGVKGIMPDEHYQNKATAAEAMVYTLDRIRRLLFFILLLMIIGLGAGAFLIYNYVL